jgi:formate dehydrogenase subunit gamma
MSLDFPAHFPGTTTTRRTREDVPAGDVIVRHRLSARLVHWSVALTFFLCLLTGMPIWTPLFGWMAGFFGGLTVCRIVHPWAGLAFTLGSVAMFLQWVREMRLERHERGWFGPKLIAYLRYHSDDSRTGKYNGGQKLFFWASGLGALGLLASGLGLWFPAELAPGLRLASILLHDVTFVLFAVAIVFHIYLGTVAEPGTLGGMTRGTVSRGWARLHHPRWHREVSGERDEEADDDQRQP